MLWPWKGDYYIEVMENSDIEKYNKESIFYKMMIVIKSSKNV